MDVYGQHIVIDSVQSSQYKMPPKTAAETETIAEDDKSFMGLVVKLGDGLLNKLKRRFNLDGLVEKIDNTKNKVKDTFSEKDKPSQKDDDDSKPEKSPPEG